MSATPGTLVTDDEKLDFLSESFDAHKALHTDGLRPPRPQAPFFNNLSECARLVPRSPDEVGAPRSQAPTPRRLLVPANVDPAAPSSAPAAVIRPSATPIADESDKGSSASQRSSARRTTASANATEYLGRLADKQSITCGPMRVLKDAFDARKRVRVLIRSAASVRGHCTGFLIAFDKHWNMILADVREEFRIQRVMREPGQRAQVTFEEARRHVAQLFIRGDQVVLVSPES